MTLHKNLDINPQKTVLITGCSSGIGYACAHYMREAGWRVFASCRKQEDCARLQGEGFESPRIDYADNTSIQSGLDEVLAATGGKLDAVFNNGAFASSGLLEDMPRDGLKEMFETNVFGVMELSRLIVPVMRAQGHGRIVQCSSVLGLAPMRGRGAYVGTKFALEGLSGVMRLELAHENIKVIMIEPGPITSKIRENAQRHFEKWVDWEKSPNRKFYEKVILPRLYDVSGKKDRFELPETAVAKKLEHALTSPNPKLHYYVTTPTYIIAWAQRLLPHKLQDALLKRI